MEVKVHSRGRPLARARVRMHSKNGPDAELKTDKRGSVHAAISPGRVRFTVSRLGYQREVRLLNGEDGDASLLIEMRAVNAWYALQRLLLAATEALALVPVAAAFAPTVRLLAKVAASMARQRALVRHAVLLAILLILPVLWAVHEYRVSPWSASYHNWIDALGFPVPHPSEDSQTLGPHYVCGRTKLLGPGEVIVRETVVIDRGARLIIQPNTTLRFAESVGIQMHGEIRAEGTAEQPIVLESSATDSPIRWAGIYVGAEPTGEDKPERVGAATFIHCRFKNAAGFEYETFGTKPGPRPKLVSSQGPHRTRGGALFIHNPAKCELSDCTFSHCQAAYGGALYLRETKGAVIKRTVFENNAAEAPDLEDVGGGAVCLWASSPSFDDCTFRNNIVRSAKGSGGAVYVGQQSIPAFRHCEFSDNRSGRLGGAIYANDTLKEQDAQTGLTGTIEREQIEQCTFWRNVSGQGGAIALKDRVSPYILQCTFCDNAAGEGTAVFIAPEYGQNVHVERLLCDGLRFEQNTFRYTEKVDGGADVSFHLGSGLEARMRSTTFCGKLSYRPVKVEVKFPQETIDGDKFCARLQEHNEDLRPTRIGRRPGGPRGSE